MHTRAHTNMCMHIHIHTFIHIRGYDLAFKCRNSVIWERMKSDTLREMSSYRKAGVVCSWLFVAHSTTECTKSKWIGGL